MAEINLFEIAARKKLRFPYNGQISVEDLWDLSVEKLDGIYKNLNMQLKQASEESLLETKSKEAKLLGIKVDIVKHIVSVKLEEKKAKEEAVLLKKRNQRIAKIIADKKDEAFKNMSVEELEKILEESSGKSEDLV